MERTIAVVIVGFVCGCVAMACMPVSSELETAATPSAAPPDAAEADSKVKAAGESVTLTLAPSPTVAAADSGAGAGSAELSTPTAAGSDRATTTPPPHASYAGTRPAPEFPPGLDWLNTDRPLTLKQLRGKLVLLDFWTYGCINCIHIIPELKRLEQEYGDVLVVIGVHSAKFENESDTDNIRQVILRYGLEHPVVNDRDFEVWNKWGARAWPTVVLVDPAGNTVGGYAGEGIYPLFKPVIDSLVQEFDAQGLLDRTPLDLKLEKAGLPETVLSFPGKVLADADAGRLFIADTNHNRIVIADSATGEVLNVVGSGQRGFADGDVHTATFAQPQGMALAADGEMLYVADTENHAVRQVDLSAERVTTLIGTGAQAEAYPPAGGTAPDVALSSPWDVALDGQKLYIAMAGSHQIWLMDLAAGKVGAFAGSGREGTVNRPLNQAELAQPSGLALDGKGRLYFADSESSSIRWADLDPEEGETGLVVGSDASLFDFGDVDGIGNEARLQHPLGVTYDAAADALYVADTYNSKIKRVDPETRTSETFAGSEHGWRDGVDPLFYEPGGIDLAAGKLYIADTNNHSIRVLDLKTKETHTLVLKGIERFMASADDAEFAGKVVQLDPVEVGAGVGRVVLDVQLPEGYKVNDEAPSSMAWDVEGGVVELPADANRSITGAKFPLELDATFNDGQGALTSDLTIIYCKAETPDICLIEQVRLVAPVQVNSAGDHTLALEYRIELPEDG